MDPEPERPLTRDPLTRDPLTRDEVRAVDRHAIEQLGIPGCVLMENAGAGAARAILEGLPDGGRVVILCGPGNNGGDGYVVARHLFLAGVAVELFSSVPAERLSGDAALQRGIVERLGLPVSSLGASELERAAAGWDGADVLVDALLGTGFEGSVRPDLAALIEAANRARVGRRVALDLPSGLDCDRGEPSNATFRADLTITFVAPKTGFSAPSAAPWVGRVRVVGIGAPAVPPT